MRSEVQGTAGETRIAKHGVSFSFYCLPDRGHRVLVTGYGEPMRLDDLEDLIATVRMEMTRRRPTDVKHTNTATGSAQRAVGAGSGTSVAKR